MTIYMCERCGYWCRERCRLFTHFEEAHCDEPPIRVEDFAVLPGSGHSRSRSQCDAEPFTSAFYRMTVQDAFPGAPTRRSRLTVR
jgi:hypothetical protein